MSTDEYNFCSDYVKGFLSIINYPDNNDEIGFIEQERTDALLDIDHHYKDSPAYELLVKDANDRADAMIFEFIKREVAEANPSLFNFQISFLNEVLTHNREFAKRLGMIIPAKNIHDYYKNYLIALDRFLKMDLESKLKQ